MFPAQPIAVGLAARDPHDPLAHADIVDQERLHFRPIAEMNGCRGLGCQHHLVILNRVEVPNAFWNHRANRQIGLRATVKEFGRADVFGLSNRDRIIWSRESRARAVWC